MTSNMDEVLKDAYVELAPYLEEHVIAKVDFFQKSPDRLCRMRWSFIVLLRMFASLRTMCVAVYVLVCVCQCVLCDCVEYDKADFWESLPVCGSCVRKSVEPCVCAVVVLLNAPSDTVAIVFRFSAVVFRISATVSRIWDETSLLKKKLLSKIFLSLYSWTCGTLCCAFVICLCVIVYHINCDGVCYIYCVLDIDSVLLSSIWMGTCALADLFVRCCVLYWLCVSRWSCFGLIVCCCNQIEGVSTLLSSVCVILKISSWLCV